MSADEVLFKRYYKALCHFAWDMLHNTDTAEDIVQDVFTNYFVRRESVSTDETSIKNFLYTSVKFACYNHIRRGQVDLKYMSSLKNEDIWYESDIELKIIRAEVMEEIHRIMLLMPEACRTVFRKGYLEGLSNSEIAEEMGISVNTVKTQKRRALKIIISKMNPEYFTAVIFVFS